MEPGSMLCYSFALAANSLLELQKQEETMPEEQIIEELPAGPIEGGGGGRVWPPRPVVAELPRYSFTQEAVTELFRLRDRVHALETELLAFKVYGRGGYIPPRYWPNELPPAELVEDARRFTGGELRGPDYPPPWEEVKALLQQILGVLTNPGRSEIPR
jgi:hypothetical protein